MASSFAACMRSMSRRCLAREYSAINMAVTLPRRGWERNDDCDRVCRREPTRLTMSDQPTPTPDENTPQDAHVSARVPERISRGVFSTGQVVLDSPKEFMIDFLQTLARPMQ